MFISLEGTEGAGKSTAMRAITEQLKALGVKFITSREPGGCNYSEELRAAVLEPRDVKIDPYAELLTILAARRQHLVEVIEPALAEGLWVVCDRFSDASFAYQCGGRKIDPAVLAQIEKLSLTDRLPNHTLLLDLPVSIGLERARQRADLDRFEQEQVTFFEDIRNAYLFRANSDPDRFDVIDAAQPIESVTSDITATVNRWYQEGSVK